MRRSGVCERTSPAASVPSPQCGPHRCEPHAQPGPWPRMSAIVDESPDLLEFLGCFRHAVAQCLLLEAAIGDLDA